MKKVLFATTALIATAGMAAADVTFSGGSRFGVIYSGGTDAVAGNMTTTAQSTTDATIAADGTITAGTTTAAVVGTVAATDAEKLAAVNAVAAAEAALAAATTALTRHNAAASLADAQANLAAISDTAAVASATDLHNRFTLNIDATAETDSGAEFFARVRVRGGNTGDDDLTATGASAPRVGVTSGALTIATGNINGAIESMSGLYDGSVGLTGLSYGNLPTNNNTAGAFAWDSFSSAGAGSNGVEVIYSANGFGAHLSYSGSSDRTAINVSYAFSDWTVALGHQDSDDDEEDTSVLTVTGSLGAVDVGLAHADNDGDRDATRINASYGFGAATTVTGYYTAASGTGRENAYGLGVTHDMGGATFAAGVANTFTGQTVADLGVRFNF